jgi:exo-beta-1,3-glucanase (GH17 family)
MPRPIPVVTLCLMLFATVCLAQNEQPCDFESWSQKLGFAYSPYRQGEAPPFEYVAPDGRRQILGLQPTRSEIEEDAEILKSIAGSRAVVRLYDIGEPAQVFADAGFCLIVGMPLASTTDGRDTRDADNVKLAQLADFVSRNGSQILYVLVGNETQAPNKARSLEELIDLIKRARDATQNSVRISAAEIYSTWLAGESLNLDLVRAVDVVTVHRYPYFDSVKAGEFGTQYLYLGLDQLKAALITSGLDRPIVVGETGHPSEGRSVGASNASPDEMGRYLSDLMVAVVQRPEYRVVWFTFADAPWQKIAEQDLPLELQYGAEGSFGIFTWQRVIRPQIAHLFPVPKTPASQSFDYRVFERGQLSYGEDAGVYSTSGFHDTLATEDSKLVFRKREGDCNNGFFITRGKPVAEVPRPRSVDLSGYGFLSVRLRSEGATSSVELFLKDATSPDAPGADQLVSVSGLGPQLKTVVIPLDQFSNSDRKLDLSRMYVLFGLNFVGNAASTVIVESISYLWNTPGAAIPGSELPFRKIIRPQRGESSVFLGGCTNRWLSLRVASSSTTDGVLSTDPSEPGAVRFCAVPNSVFTTAFFQVGDGVKDFQDFSEYASISMDIRGADGGEPLMISMKERGQPNSPGPRQSAGSISRVWRTFTFGLDRFTGINLKQITIPLELVYEEPRAAHCLFVRNVNFGTQPASPALRITQVSPSSGLLAGGTTVRILGTGFSQSTSVLFGGTPARSIRFIDSSTLEVVTPSGSGKATVNMRNPDGQSASLDNAFTFQTLTFSNPAVQISVSSCRIQGRVTGVNMPHELRAVVYAVTDRGYLQPCGLSEQRQSIEESGLLGPIDTHSGSIFVMLVSPSYNPPAIVDGLPQVDGISIFARSQSVSAINCDVARCRAQ